jgi:hypothetical protein
VNLDGRLNARDDVNDDGVINRADARGAGQASAAASAGNTGAGSGNLIGSLSGLSQSQLRSALGSLEGSDVAKIKKACAEVLASPGDESDSALAVCRVVAAL